MYSFGRKIYFGTTSSSEQMHVQACMPRAYNTSGQTLCHSGTLIHELVCVFYSICKTNIDGNISIAWIFFFTCLDICYKRFIVHDKSRLYSLF